MGFGPPSSHSLFPFPEQRITNRSESDVNQRHMASAVNTLQRLSREYQELLATPVRNIVVAPLDEDQLLEPWHGNIKGADGTPWQDIVVHFIISFPRGYPAFPPKVRLCSFVDHLNVITSFNGGNEVCLDMLEKPMTQEGVSTIPYVYWSSAFSVRSILVQLSSFLLCSEETKSHAGLTRTILEAGQFECSAEGCSHSHNNPFPHLPSDEKIDSAPLSFPCVEVSGVSAQLLQTRIFNRRVQLQQQLMMKSKEEENCDEETSSRSSTTTTTCSSNSSSSSINRSNTTST